MSDAVAVAAVIAVAMLLRTTIGFGDALLAMPLLTLLIGVRAAAPLLTAVSLTVAAMVLLYTRRAVVLRDARGLLLGALPGVPVGVVALRSVPEPLLAGLLGALVAAFGAWRLIRLRIAPPDDPLSAKGANAAGTDGRLAPLVGFAAGVLGASTGAGGPPVVVYGVVSGWSPQRFRATLQAFFLCSGTLAAVGYAWAGLWTATTLHLYLAALPGVLLALAVGTRLARRVSAERFAGFVAATVTALGLVLLADALR